MEPDDGRNYVRYGESRAYWKQRNDGLFSIHWREGGKPRSTTRVLKKDAVACATKMARKLNSGKTGRLLSVEDSQISERFKKISGSRSPFIVLDVLEDATRRLGGWEGLSKAVQHYEDSGMLQVQRVPMDEARKRFLDYYDKRDVETQAGLRKELNAFARAGYGEIAICDLTCEILEPWVARKKEDGEEVEPRTHNNRLSTWKTFLNKCREWKMWPQKDKHPGELVKRQKEPDDMPVIFTLDQCRRLLKAVQEKKPKLLNCLCIGCWMGPRPAEIARMPLGIWDAPVKGYAYLDSKVAGKVKQARYVPIPDNVRRILGGPIQDPRQRTKTRGRHDPMCCGSEDIAQLSRLARDEGIIEEWTPDIMRHSRISYWLARGISRTQAAEWSGNSEAEIRDTYRHPLPKEDGEAWELIGL